MKLAEVYWDGPSRVHVRRGPSEERYRFQKGQLGAPDQPAHVYEIEDALFFAGHDAFEVEWTAIGKVAQKSMELEAPADGVEAMLSDMGYRTKQSLAKKLGLNAGGKEEELEERLRPEIEQLQESMEVLSQP